jgi:hypothetical protein
VQDPSEADTPRPAVGVELWPIPRHPSSLTVRWLGQPEPLLVHYRPNQIGVPCGQEWDCPLCGRRGAEAPRWHGYTSVLLHQPQSAVWIHAVVVVSEGLSQLVLGRTLRGETWRLSRQADRHKKRWPITGTCVGRIDPSSLPPATDVVQWARRFYRSPHLVLDAVDPRPPIQLREPVPEAPAPAPVPAAPVPAAAAPAVAEEPEKILTLDDVRCAAERGGEVVGRILRRQFDRQQGQVGRPANGTH